MLVVMTFDEYDEALESMSQFGLREQKAYYPTADEIEQHSSAHNSHMDDKRFVLFLSWLLEKNPEPTTDSERDSTSAMKKFIRDNLELVDTNSEVQARMSELQEIANGDLQNVVSA